MTILSVILWIYIIYSYYGYIKTIRLISKNIGPPPQGIDLIIVFLWMFAPITYPIAFMMSAPFIETQNIPLYHDIRKFIFGVKDDSSI